MSGWWDYFHKHNKLIISILSLFLYLCSPDCSLDTDYSSICPKFGTTYYEIILERAVDISETENLIEKHPEEAEKLKVLHDNWLEQVRNEMKN